MKINTDSLKEITVKELIGVIVFCFSMSGLYYKLFYNTDVTGKALQSYMKTNDIRINNLESSSKIQFDILRAEMEMLKDDYKARKAIEDYKKSEFLPLKKQ